jgi:translation initiation factor IF-1
MRDRPIISKEGALLLQGVIIDSCRQFYTVSCDSLIIRATLCGRMRVHKIHCVRGDSVTVECCPYQLDRGRIIHRH